MKRLPSCSNVFNCSSRSTAGDSHLSNCAVAWREQVLSEVSKDACPSSEMSGGRIYYKFPSMPNFEAVSVFEDSISVRDLMKRLAATHQLKEGTKLLLKEIEGGKGMS